MSNKSVICAILDFPVQFKQFYYGVIRFRNRLHIALKKLSVVCLALAGLSFTYAQAQIPTTANPPLDTAPLTIMDGDGEQVAEFTVEQADDPEERRRGYMFREAPNGSQGMIFRFPPNDIPSMFMANVSFPLDLIFIASDGQIEGIVHYAQPGSLRSLSVGLPSAAVLEVIGGRSEELGIEPGMKVHHPWVSGQSDDSEKPADESHTP